MYNSILRNYVAISSDFLLLREKKSISIVDEIFAKEIHWLREGKTRFWRSHCGGWQNARAYTCISISRIYFSPVYAHIASWSANCRCHTRLEQEEHCFIRAYRMCTLHPVRAEECATIHANALSRPISFSRGLQCRAQRSRCSYHTLAFFIVGTRFVVACTRETIRARLATLFAYSDLLIKIRERNWTIDMAGKSVFLS